MRERAHCGASNRLIHTEGVALPYQAQSVAKKHFFAAKPGVPGRLAARAVGGGARQDAVGIDDGAIGVEADRADAASARGELLAVGDINPAAVPRVEARAAIGGVVPGVGGAAHHFGRPGDDAIREALWQRDTVLVWCLQLSGGRWERVFGVATAAKQW